MELLKKSFRFIRLVSRLVRLNERIVSFGRLLWSSKFISDELLTSVKLGKMSSLLKSSNGIKSPLPTPNVLQLKALRRICEHWFYIICTPIAYLLHQSQVNIYCHHLTPSTLLHPLNILCMCLYNTCGHWDVVKSTIVYLRVWAILMLRVVPKVSLVMAPASVTPPHTNGSSVTSLKME